MKKSIQKKGRKTGCPPTTGPGARSLPLGPGGHTNQQDRIQSIRGKTKIISLGEILKGEVLKGEVLKDKPQQKLTRPGRLRARSGYIGPRAFPGFAGSASRLWPGRSGRPIWRKTRPLWNSQRFLMKIESSRHQKRVDLNRSTLFFGGSLPVPLIFARTGSGG